MRLRVNRNSQIGEGEAKMTHQPRVARAAEPPSAGSDPVVIDSITLMGGRRELLIRHGEGTYRLRLTASNKLILTK